MDTRKTACRHQSSRRSEGAKTVPGGFAVHIKLSARLRCVFSTLAEPSLGRVIRHPSRLVVFFLRQATLVAETMLCCTMLPNPRPTEEEISGNYKRHVLKVGAKRLVDQYQGKRELVVEDASPETDHGESQGRGGKKRRRAAKLKPTFGRKGQRNKPHRGGSWGLACFHWGGLFCRQGGKRSNLALWA